MDLHNGWLNAMKSSSPPRSSRTKEFNNEVPLDDAVYKSWQLKYLSALKSLKNITKYGKGKRIAIFLDYDGTLSPIVNHPEHAIMSDDMRSAVKNVAMHFPTAIISGRSIEKVTQFVGLPNLHYAGSHGMDIEGPVTHSMTANDHPNCIRSTNKQVRVVQA